MKRLAWAWLGLMLVTGSGTAKAEVGTGTAWATADVGTEEAQVDTIAAWKNQALKANVAVVADEGNRRNKGVAIMWSDKALDKEGTYTYYKSSSAGGTTIDFANLNLKGYTDIKLTFYACGSQGMKIDVSKKLTPIDTIDKSTETQYSISDIPNTLSSFLLKYMGTSGSFYFGTVVLSGTRVELPKYTVSFSTGGAAEVPKSLTEEVGGEGVTLPEVTAECGKWKFVGWTEKAISSATASVDSKNLYKAGTVYEPSADCTLYAVYQQVVESGSTLPDSVVLWSEDFSHFGTKKPSATGMGSGTVTYEGAEVTYAEKGSSTKGSAGNKAGGVSPELQIASDGYFSIKGIPTGGAEKMLLTFQSTSTTLSVTATNGVKDSLQSGTYRILTIPAGVKIFTLQIANSSSSTIKIDDVVLKNYTKADTSYLSAPVCEKEAVLVESIALYHDAQTLQEGDSCYLAARVSPANAWNKQVVYTIGDERIATMNGCRVKVQTGNAIIGEQTDITVAAADGGGAQATYTLTVSEGNYHIYIDDLHHTDTARFGTTPHAIGRSVKQKGTHTVPFLFDVECGASGCTATHKHFVGWVESPIVEGVATEPEDLVQAGATVSPKENKTYYAVWTDGTDYRTRCTGEWEAWDVQVVEWYADKLVVAYDHSTHTVGNGLSATLNGSATAATLTELGGNLAEIAIEDLDTHADEELVLSYTATDGTQWQSKTFITPAVVVGEKETSTEQTTIGSLLIENRDGFDIAVREKSVLTIDGRGKQNTFGTLTIHPTAKVIVPAGKTLTLDTLVLRSGIAEVGTVQVADSVPQLYLAGDMVCKAIVYEMRVDGNQYYGFSLPYDVQKSAIVRGYDPSGEGLTAENFSVLYYDGALRAKQNYANDAVWADAGETLQAGVGYIVAADPVANESSTLLRFPMAGFSTATSETAKSVTVNGWESEQATDVRENHKGWNLVANPYLATYAPSVSGEEDAAFGGKILAGEDKVRYLTLPNSDYSGFTQLSVQDKDLRLLPFKNFFVQIEGDEQTMAFALDQRQQVLAALQARAMAVDEIETGIRLTDGRETDCAGLLIGEGYSISRSDGIRNDVPKAPAATGLAVYTLGNGYELALNALSRSEARARIPLGIRVAAAGKYTLEYNESFLAENEDIEAIWVEDNGVQVANLLVSPYLFTAEQGTDELRLALRVVFAGDSETPTGIDEVQQTLTDIPVGAEIEVFDALGHCVLTTTATLDWVRLRLPIGVYTLRMTYGGCSTTRKIVAGY